MVKTKEIKKRPPLIAGDLEVDPSILKKLKLLQEEHQRRFGESIAEARTRALVSYKSRIESLTKAKDEMLKEYSSEIKKYSGLVKDLEEMTDAQKP